MRTLATLDKPIRSLIVSPDGSTVVTASGTQVGLLALASQRRSVRSLGQSVYCLAWGPDGLVAGTAEGEVWTVGARPARLIEAIDEEICGLAVAGDGTIAACGGEPCAVAVFGRRGDELWRVEPYKWPYCVRFSASGEQLALATWDGQLHILEVDDLPDRLRGDTEYAGGPVFDAQFLPDGNVAIAGARFVRVWDRSAGRYTRTRELDTEALAITVSPDGRCAIASTNDQQLRRYRLPDLVETGRIALGHGGSETLSDFPEYAEFTTVKGRATVRALAFHPDSARVFGATEDARIIEVSCAELDRAAPAKPVTPARPRAPIRPVGRSPTTASRDQARARPTQTAATRRASTRKPRAAATVARKPPAKTRAAKK